MRTRFLPLAVVVALLAFTPHHVTAQGTRAGAYLGSSIATLQEADNALLGLGSAAVTRERRIGVQAGAWLNRPLAGGLSLQPEVHYTQKGARYRSAIGLGFEIASGSAALELAYLEVPLLLRLDLANTGGVRPFVLAGPAIAYRSGCSLNVQANGIGANFDCNDSFDNANLGDGLRTFDTNAVFGGGLAFRLGGRDYSAGVRYSAGLTSISEVVSGVTNGNYSVLLGLGF
jgi:hypothetical protein